MQSIREWFFERCIVKKGSCRVVIDFVRLGFVVKLPIVHIARLFKGLRHYVKGTAHMPFFRWIMYPMHSEGYWGG